MDNLIIDNPHIKIQYLIQELNIEVLNELIHRCIDDLTFKNSLSFDKFKSLTNWTQEQYNEIVSLIKNLFTHLIITNSDDDKILNWCPEIDKEHHNVFLSCFKIRKNEIQKALLLRNSAISGDILNDFDWKIKWIYGSNTLATLRESLVELNLNLSENFTDDESDQHSSKCLNLEMDKEEINMLIRNLEKGLNSFLS